MYSFKQHSFMKTETEALLFGVFMEKEAAFQLLDEAFSGELQELYDSRDLTYEAGSVVKLHTFGKIASKRIYFVGLGKREDVTKDSLRKAFGKAFKQLAKDHIQEASLAVDSLINLPLDDAVAFEAVGEAHALAPFVLKTYHTNKKSKPDIQLTELTLVSEAADRESNILKGISLGFALGEGQTLHDVLFIHQGIY